MRALVIALALSLLIVGCFGSRTSSEFDTNNPAGDEGKDPGSAGSPSGTGGVVSNNTRRDGGSSTPPRCGDGVIQYSQGEQCDLGDLGGESCESLSNGRMFGDLYCHPDCTFNKTLCYFDPTNIDAGRLDGGRAIRDAGRDATRIIDYDDAGEDNGERVAVGGNCVRSTGSACDRDIDCRVGGCGGEICYNPNLLDIGNAPCDGCQTPRNQSCGCVNGGCTWWY